MENAGVLGGCGICSCLLAVLFAFNSVKSLDNTQYGLQLSWWNEEVSDNNGVAFGAGMYFTGPTTSFIIFPSKIETLEFGFGYDSRPAIWSRTSDGLAVELECSLQYQVMPASVSALYHTLGTWDQAEAYMAKIAQSIIMTEATHYTAEEFFANRTTIAPLMEAELREQFASKIYAGVQFFQLQEVILPREFEEAVKNTTLTNQQIAIYEAQRSRLAVEWETELLKMEQHVGVRLNKARGEATEIVLSGEAKGQRLVLQAEGDAAAILQKSRSAANASASQREADAESVLTTRQTEAATIRLQSMTHFNATNRSYYLQAAAYAAIRESVGSEERFLDLMKVKALQNVSWNKMSVNLANIKDPLAFMGLASGASSAPSATSGP